MSSLNGTKEFTPVQTTKTKVTVKVNENYITRERVALLS